METIEWIVIITAIAGVGGTGLGGAVSSVFKRDSHEIVSLLLSFAGGVMISVVCFDLITDAINPSDASEQTNIYIVLAGMAIGYGVVCLLNMLIDKRANKNVLHIDGEHPKTADDLDELIHSDNFEEHLHRSTSGTKKQSGKHLFVAGLVMAVAIALHNLPEGMVIGASYANDTAEPILGSGSFLLAVVIGLHNIPEGMAVATPLITGGLSRPKAIVVTALSGVPTVIGAVIGYFIGMLGHIMLALSLSFAGGAMLYVVLGELIPESILMWRSKMPAFATLIGIFVGILIIYA